MSEGLPLALLKFLKLLLLVNILEANLTVNRMETKLVLFFASLQKS